MSDLAQTLSWIQDETRLVTELRAGSDVAFDWLVTYYHASVYSVIYGILSDRADAADVTQEVFLKAFRGIGAFRQGSSLKTWLYRIAVRESLNHRRWWHRHARNEISLDAPANDDQPIAELADSEATPFEQLATRETQAAVHGALMEIPEVYRSAVILRDLEGLSYDEVAEILETSIATVKTRILRGRRALKELLDPVLRARRTSVSERRFASASTNESSTSHRAGSYGAILLTGGRGGWQ